MVIGISNLGFRLNARLGRWIDGVLALVEKPQCGTGLLLMFEMDGDDDDGRRRL